MPRVEIKARGRKHLRLTSIIRRLLLKLIVKNMTKGKTLSFLNGTNY